MKLPGCYEGDVQQTERKHGHTTAAINTANTTVNTTNSATTSLLLSLLL